MELKQLDRVCRLPFWGDLTEEQRSLFLQNMRIVSFPKGTCVHSGADECVGVMLVLEGQLRTAMLSEDGREITLYRLFAEDVCILSASCVLDAITFDVVVSAEEDTRVLTVGSTVFRRISEENLAVRCFAYETAAARFSDVMWAMQQILFMGADKRLAIFLWDELSKTGGNEVHLTHEQIARYMGSAREVVSRMLKYFAAEGVVALSRGGVKITDKDKLKAFFRQPSPQ